MTRARSDWKGREVSCRNHQVLVEELRKKGAGVETLFEGLPYSREHLANKNERIDWDSMRRMLRNAAAIWTDEELERIGRIVPTSRFSRPLLLMLGTVYAPRDVYRWLFGKPNTGANQLVTCIHADIETPEPDRLQIEFAVHDGYDYCREVFILVKGALASAPTMIGYSEARVEGQLTSRGARFSVALPPRPPLFHRLRRGLGGFRRNAATVKELRRAHDLLHRRYAEQQRQIEKRDRAERALRMKENELRQAQKLEAVGRMAGGIAHDFNNLLSVIMGHGDFLRADLERDGRSTADVDQILRSAERGARLTQQLLTYSRGQLLKLEPLDLNEVVRRTAEIFERILGEQVELKLELDPRLPSIKADPGQMEQLLTNLALNARDAMPEGGALLIETRDHDGAARLQVTDSGIGIAPEVLDKIFDPFFTTKPDRIGTGLGLSTVYGIVKQSGGTIDVESEPSVGTTFRIHFPGVAGTVVPSPRHVSPMAPDLAGRETILVAEDEVAVRQIVCETLRRRGYRVMSSPNGEEALALVEREDRPIDLLLTDLVMPRLGGRALGAEFRQRHPDAPILYLSGYVGDAGDLGELLADEQTGVLSKPIAPDTLLLRVRELLQTAR